jgi:hypothetical protein
MEQDLQVRNLFSIIFHVLLTGLRVWLQGARRAHRAARLHIERLGTVIQLSFASVLWCIIAAFVSPAGGGVVVQPVDAPGIQDEASIKILILWHTLRPLGCQYPLVCAYFVCACVCARIRARQSQDIKYAVRQNPNTPTD